MRNGVRRLSAFPRHQLLPDELLTAKVSELALLEHLGPPTAESEPGFGDPCFYWDLVWDCGLVMAVEYHQLSEEIHVGLDALDFDHAIRHLGGEVSELVLLPDADGARYRELEIDEPDRIWVLWHKADDGEPEIVASGLTERDAACRRDEIEGSWLKLAE